MPHYKILLCYDGTPYFGWQATRMGPSIQETLQKAIHQITAEKPLPEAASRTDRGVHAEEQVVSFALQRQWEPLKLQRALNAALPQEIRILRLEIAPTSFHPTLDAKEKEYHYRVCLGPVQEPLFRLYSWHYPFPLDLSAMEEAAKNLLGTHDFAAFANRAEKNPICTLTSIEMVPLDANRMQIRLKGNRFLYKMARNIAGTLLYIGSGKLPAESVSHILAKRDRTLAGMTAPAQGLFLHSIFY